MRVPFGSSKTSARSCGQNSPSMPPSGVTLTLCAAAGSATAARAALRLAAARNRMGVMVSGPLLAEDRGRAHVARGSGRSSSAADDSSTALLLRRRGRGGPGNAGDVQPGAHRIAVGTRLARSRSAWPHRRLRFARARVRASTRACVAPTICAASSARRSGPTTHTKSAERSPTSRAKPVGAVSRSRATAAPALRCSRRRSCAGWSKAACTCCACRSDRRRFSRSRSSGSDSTAA